MNKPKIKVERPKHMRCEFGPSQGQEMMRGLVVAARKLALEEETMKGKLATDAIQ